MGYYKNLTDFKISSEKEKGIFKTLNYLIDYLLVKVFGFSISPYPVTRRFCKCKICIVSCDGFPILSFVTF